MIEILVVISIIALLAAILFPVFARARENARRASCQSNLKQIGIGLMMYAQDYDDTLVFDAVAGNAAYVDAGAAGVFTEDRWPGRVFPYIKSTQVFRCPSHKPLIAPGTSGSAANAFRSALAVGGVTSYWGQGSLFHNGASVIWGVKPVKLSMIEEASNSVYVFDDILRRYGNNLNFRYHWDNLGASTTNHYMRDTGSPSSKFSVDQPMTHFDGANVLF